MDAPVIRRLWFAPYALACDEGGSALFGQVWRVTAEGQGGRP